LLLSRADALMRRTSSRVGREVTTLISLARWHTTCWLAPRVARSLPPRVARSLPRRVARSNTARFAHSLVRSRAPEIVALSEAMGYTEDAPVSLGRDVRRNENCVWVVDQPTLNQPIFERCAALLPRTLELATRDGGVARIGPVAGLNQRWRLYKYAG